MKLEIGFGNGTQPIEVPDQNLKQILKLSDLPETEDEQVLIHRALEHPIGSKSLKEICSYGEKVAIVTSDLTRPMPTWKVLPALLEELNQAGIPDSDIVLVFALGSHRPMTEAEMQHLMGEAYGRIAGVNSSEGGFENLGTTSRGTPVILSKAVADADRVICLGNVEYHYFAGYSGGAKAVMPGCSVREAIACNHRFMTDPESYAGHLDGNPVREDIEEAGKMLGIDFILNVVVSPQKKILHASAGDAVLAHRDACRFLDSIYQVPIEERADIVIVSQGGAPKDLNLYQTQKALANAGHAVKPGGIIILAGSCREGFGESHFEDWMRHRSPAEMVQEIQEHFILGGHKAAAIAQQVLKGEIDLVSEMDPEIVRETCLIPYASVQTALDHALKEKGPEASVIVMPYGGSTLPLLKR